MCDCHEGELRHAKGRKVTSELDRPQGHQQGADGPGWGLAEVALATSYICEVNYKRKWEGCCSPVR